MVVFVANKVLLLCFYYGGDHIQAGLYLQCWYKHVYETLDFIVKGQGWFLILSIYTFVIGCNCTAPLADSAGMNVSQEG